MPDEILSDYEFVRLLADRASFMIKDVDILWRAAKEIILENVAKRRQIYFYGFLDVRYTKYKKKKQWDGIRKQYTDPKTIDRISIKFGRKVSKELKKDRPDESI